MSLFIILLILLTLTWLCGKILGIAGYIGSITGTIIAIIYILLKDT